jgi:DNA-binding transcriptional ArsR family regulator
MSNDNADFTPEPALTLTNKQQIKAYVHPTRIMLLRLLAQEKRTISSIAKENGVHPANITHHFRILEQAGLIRLVEKRDTGKNLEKYYRAVVHHFVIQPDALPGQTGLNKKALGLEILRDHLSAAIKAVSQHDEDDIVALLGVARLTAEDAARFEKKIAELFDEFGKCDSPAGKPYTLNLSAYPSDFYNVTMSEKEKILL